MSDSFGCDPSWSQAIVSDDAPLPTVPVIDITQAAVVDASAGSRGKLPKQWALDETMLALRLLSRIALRGPACDHTHAARLRCRIATLEVSDAVVYCPPSIDVAPDSNRTLDPLYYSS